MTEGIEGNAEQHAESNPTMQPLSSAGQMLRQAREEKQMSVQALASALKVPAYKLEALEEGRWDLLTDSVFARALALSVCRFLRLPSAPVLAGMPKLEGARLAANPEGINAPFKDKTLRSLMAPSHESGSGRTVKLVVALLIAVAGGAGLYFVPQWQPAEGDEADSVTAAATGVNTEPLFMPLLQAPPEAPASASTGAVTEADSVAVAETAAQAAAAASVTAETAAPVLAEPSAASAPVAAVAGSRVLRFSASGESWVQVRDAQQQVLMEKILKSGEVFQETVAGRPLHVIVGNAGATTLEIDGAAFDLAASARNNVARFEVK